ncbi:unnamed protein product [Kluyveromyces dobzhanskii CBS 2104]|uniref:WGS project CCBQ000000000 data, contig 00041 n=1 Tax=Kluyveromyces dobzhanskii CBS 2104 TaxID=1427455 RepID=A0A0A8L003_9SACH|nr:unnamed protein product [Kluyveromyces dobzhanskii CBS 2104]
MSVHTPQVLWAQRSSETEPSKNVLFLTINIPDCTDPKLELTETALEFSALSKYHSEDGIKYHLHIDFYEPIDTANSEQKVANGRNYFLVLRKKELNSEFWPRLTKEKLKYHYIKTDFDRWVDEDEQEEAVAADNDMMSQLGQMGGAGGFPGMGGAGGFPGMEGAGGFPGMGGAGFPGMGQGFDPEALAAAGINLDEAMPEEDGEDEDDES